LPVHIIIVFFVEDISIPDSTLAEVSANFLISLPAQNREAAQGEIHKFIRWVGLHRKVGELSPPDIASYAERVTPSEAKLVKTLLSYAHKRGFTSSNLAVHLRARKTSRKMAVPVQQNRQAQITPQGYAKLKADLANLKSQRSLTTEEIRRAAADKDFRENAPLAAAREHKAHLEGRIQELEATLKLATIMDENHRTSKVEIGDTITLCALSSGEQLRYALVDTQEANATEGRISVASPIGKTLLHKEKGQTVEISAPAGIFRYRIEDIQHRIF